MNVLCFPTGPYATNMYIIGCKDAPNAVIVDPGEKSFEIVLNTMQEHSLKPVAIWLTHSHWDHIVDAAKIKRELSIPIYIHEEDRGNLEKPGSDGVPMAVPPFEGAKPDHLIKEGDILNVGNNSFKVIHTPGHTPGGVCFYCEREKILFSGDTFYRGLIGALSLPTSQAERVWPSLDKIALLPPDTVIYPGHGSSTTIKRESWLSDARKLGVVHKY
jgi:hydroxyacylglutathione hydrolase